MSAGRYTVGIDPGKRGGAVILAPDGDVLQVARMPVRRDGAYDARAIAVLAAAWSSLAPSLDVWCEAAQHVRIGGRLLATPTKVVAECVALWTGAFAAHGVTVREVAPRSWQAVVLAGVPGATTKARALLACRIRWGAALDVSDGVADALLVAAYGREERQCGRVT